MHISPVLFRTTHILRGRTAPPLHPQLKAPGAPPFPGQQATCGGQEPTRLPGRTAPPASATKGITSNESAPPIPMGKCHKCCRLKASHRVLPQFLHFPTGMGGATACHLSVLNINRGFSRQLLHYNGRVSWHHSNGVRGGRLLSGLLCGGLYPPSSTPRGCGWRVWSSSYRQL